MHLRRLAAATALAVAAAPLLTTTANSADTALGDDFTPDYSGCGQPATILQTSSAAPRYTVPTAGVITSWRITGAASGPSIRSFKVGRATGATYAITASSAPVVIPSGQSVTQSARIAVQPGDVLGLSYADSTACAKVSSATDGFIIVSGDAQPGPVTGTPTTITGYRFPVSAVLEADADNDGYGDTTQDKCPTQASTQGACRDITAPDTRITSIKAAKAKLARGGKSDKRKFQKAKASVSFTSTETGSTFTCSVDGATYTACTSPLKVKLKKGTHTVAVKATDAAGNVDATPATTTVKIKKAKQGKHDKSKK